MHTGATIPPNPMEELEKNRKSAEERQLTKKERRKLKKHHEQEERQKEQRKNKMQKFISIAVIILVGGGGLFALGWFLMSQSGLPPTVSQNHSEQSPPSHIVAEPIQDRVQRHMLEHADGGGAPGIIIQYNCDKFACEPDLVEKLTELVNDYPENVYLAPNNYDGKIILTKLGKLEVLENFDEQFIENFIR